MLMPAFAFWRPMVPECCCRSASGSVAGLFARSIAASDTSVAGSVRELGHLVGNRLLLLASVDWLSPALAHESPRTTKLYDRTSDDISLDEVERIVI
jgi:hypothetical protein